MGVLYACVFYFCICTCSAQLSMFHMEKRSRNTLIIIIIIIIIINVPDGHFHVFIFSEGKFYAIYKSEDWWPSYMFLNMVVRHSALLRKLALNVEDFYVKAIGWG